MPARLASAMVAAMILGATSSSAEQLLLPGSLLMAGVLATWFGVRLWRRYWVVVDTPTSSCAAVFVGRNEVAGRAEPHVALTAPITGRPCVWFRWKLERYVRSGKRGNWKTIEDRSTNAPFWVVDDTGSVLVRPRDAEVDVPKALGCRANQSGLRASQQHLRMASFEGEDAEERARSEATAPSLRASSTPIGELGRDHRISEWHIEVGQQVFLLGTAMLRRDAVGLELAKHHGPDGLLISTSSEAEVARKSRRRAVAGLLLGLVAAVLVPAVFQLLSVDDPSPGLVTGDPAPPFLLFAFVGIGVWGYYRLLQSPLASVWQAFASFAFMAFWPLRNALTHYGYLTETSRSLWDLAGGWMVLGGGAYLAFLVALYGVRVYNRLVAVKQQAAVAWSLIDVALRRRHDLLPNLAAVASQYAAHERQVAEAIAGLRLGEAVTSSEALPDDAALRSAVELDRREAQGARTLLRVSEATPELAADEVFRDLARRITQVEDQVAFARRFYNDAVTVLRDRRRTFPGILVAPWVATPSWDLFTAAAE